MTKLLSELSRSELIEEMLSLEQSLSHWYWEIDEYTRNYDTRLKLINIYNLVYEIK